MSEPITRGWDDKRLAEKKGSPRIDFEVVYFMTKPHGSLLEEPVPPGETGVELTGSEATAAITQALRRGARA